MLLINVSSVLLGQSQKKNQNTQTIQEAIEAIESGSDYIFNYNPTLLVGYNTTGKLDLTSISKDLDSIFYDSPFLYEIDGHTILVYLPSPQTYVICGTIKDALSQEPLVAANITVLDSMIGTQTDLSGYFEFECTGHKDQEIEISYLGYQSIQFSMQEIIDNDCISWNMEINRDILGREIVIRDYLIDGISLGDEFTAFNLDFNQLSKSHSNVEHDVLKTAQLLPGITSIDDSAANLQIRGSNPGQNLVLWEGVPLYNSGHVFGMVSAINPFSVESVSIYKGAYNPKYDNRVGGVVDISLPDEMADRLHGSFGTTFTEAHSNLSIPIIKNKLTIELAGRQTINGLFYSPTLQSYTDKVFQFSIIDDQKDEANLDQINTELTLDYSDWNAKVIYRPTEKLKINGGYYQNVQDFSYSFWLNDDPYLSIDKIELRTQIISLETELEMTKKWAGKLSFYQSSYENKYQKIQSENEIIFGRNVQLNQINEQSITYSNDISLGSQLLLNLGYEYNFKDVVLDLGEEIDFDSEFIPFENESATFHNLFQSFSYSTKKLHVDVGNRSSYYQQAERLLHSPRVNARYTIGENIKLKADAGIYHQFISQLTNVGANQIKVDNPLWILNTTGESLSQLANKVAAGIVYHKGNWLFDLDFYYNQISNITTVAPQQGIITNLNGFAKGKSSVTGIDILLKKSWSSGLSTWMSYSLGFAKYDFQDLSEDSFIAPNDIRHNLSFVTSYKYKGFHLSLNANYHSGLPYSQGRLTFNLEEPNAAPPFLYLLTYESINEERLNQYLRLDLNIGYKFDFKLIKGSQVEISTSILNILNRSNNVAREYYVDYNETTDLYKLSFIQKSLLDRTALILLRFYW